MEENPGISTIKEINAKCLRYYYEKYNQKDLKSAYEILTGKSQTDFLEYNNDYQKFWDWYMSSLPEVFNNGNLSGESFFYGPKEKPFISKEFNNCIFFHTHWIQFHASHNTFNNCNFSFSHHLISMMSSNRYISCDFSNSHFDIFNIDRMEEYRECNFTDTLFHCQDPASDISKGFGSSFEGSTMKDCTLVFDPSLRMGNKKLSKSQLKDWVNHVFTPDQVSEMKIDYKRFW